MCSAGEMPNVGLRARRHIAFRLLPYLFTLYIIAFLDRVNVSYAGLGMARDVGFTDRIFGLGAGIYFLGYFLFEIPGALIVERWSARRAVKAKPQVRLPPEKTPRGSPPEKIGAIGPLFLP